MGLFLRALGASGWHRGVGVAIACVALASWAMIARRRYRRRQSEWRRAELARLAAVQDRKTAAGDAAIAAAQSRVESLEAAEDTAWSAYVKAQRENATATAQLEETDPNVKAAVDAWMRKGK